jgi:hypothetical protein
LIQNNNLLFLPFFAAFAALRENDLPGSGLSGSGMNADIVSPVCKPVP